MSVRKTILATFSCAGFAAATTGAATLRRLMMTRATSAVLTLAAATLVLGFTAPNAEAADPVCQFGFQTVVQENWILKCRKTAPMAQKGVLLTEAGNASCNTSRYWNFGPKVTAQHLRRNTMVRVEYLCGHVEG